MPRQQLRNVEDTIELSRHFCLADELPKQVSSGTIFENDAPLQVEVGSGKGLFLLKASEKHPDQNFIGIEIARKYAKYAAKGLAHADRSNAFVVSGDALPVFENQIADSSIQAVHVYFPDPWWKKKHKKRRVVNESFIRNVSSKLIAGGTFHFWTDVLEYFDTAIELIAIVAPELGPPIPEEPEKTEVGTDAKTHFERRSLKHEIPVYRVRFEKPAR